MPRPSISHHIRSRRFYVEGDATDCWEWSGSLSQQGYGQIRAMHDGPTLSAHRVVYEDRVGAIPEGLHIDHLCRNRKCVNPSHLEPVTPRENSHRGLAGPKVACPHEHTYEAHGYRNPDGSGGRRCRKCDTARARRWALAHPQVEGECVTCGVVKPIMAKGQCNACYLRARRAARGRSDRPTTSGHAPSTG